MQYEYQNPAENIALAIYRDEHAAQQALDASPIHFALEKVTDIETETQGARLPTEDADDEHDPQTSRMPAISGIDDILRPSQLQNRAPDSTANTTATTPPPTPSMPFDPPPTSTSQTQQHWIRSFQVIIDRSRAVHQDYIERQPYWKQFSPTKSMAQKDLEKSVPHLGLSDVSKRPPNAQRTPLRVLRTMSEYVDRAMPTLRGIVENGDMEQGFLRRRRTGWRD